MLKGYLVPHPPLIVPGVGKGSEINDTRRAYLQIAGEMKEYRPETVVMISPHSVMYSDYIHIAPGDGESGDLGAFGAGNIKFKVSYDQKLAALTGELARKRGIQAGSSGRNPAGLDHGITVPLYFLREENNAGYPFKIVRVSLSGLSVLDHYKLGMCLTEAAGRLGRKTAIIASGDMSHKLKAGGPYGFVPEGPEFDGLVCDCIRQNDILKLMSIEPALCEKAAECGYKSLVMALGAFDGLKTDCRLLNYEGPFGVGYLTAAFTAEAHAESLLPRIAADMNAKIEKTRAQEDEYTRIARLNIEHFVRRGGKINGLRDIPQSMLNARAGVFVSIKKDGILRGCIGTIAPVQKNIYEEIISNGIAAASADPRFDPIEESELNGLTYSVDVLAPAEPVSGMEELDAARYGVIVRCGRKSGLLLPALEGIDTVEEQVDVALKKAGIRPDEPYTLERFEVVRHK